MTQAAVFDSGVGGLSIVGDLRRLVPKLDIIFCCDSAHYPYGVRTEEEVIEAVTSGAQRLASRFQIDLFVVACNTASTVVLPTLRQNFNFPIVGVVPAIKPAALKTQSKKIGLLATPGTCSRPYTDTLIAEHAKGTIVHKHGSRALVDLAEAKLRGKKIDPAIIAKEIAPLFNPQMAGSHPMDTVVLGCTHFPLLIKELIESAPWPVNWIDSGEAVAARVHELLQKQAIARPCTGHNLALCTRFSPEMSDLTPALLTYGFSGIEEV